MARLKIGAGQTIPPARFIEAAKQAKLSGLITIRILAATIEIARRHRADFSVNISSEDMLNRTDKERIYAMLEANQDVAPHIVFEILETEDIEDYEIVGAFIRRVKSYGCRIAIDDFGSGYSNFEKLLQLDIDIVKIDGTLIRNLHRDAHAQLVARTIVEFARGAGLTTVAEFVHSEAVLAKVKELGIDEAQGFYLGEPKEARAYFTQ